MSSMGRMSLVQITAPIESSAEALHRVRSWHSYHVFLPGSIDLFLVQYLPVLLSECLRAGLFRRFFFIRYSEGGDHLRLRFMPHADGGERKLRSAIERTLSRYARELRAGQFDRGPEPFRVEEHPYCRQTLYFGETLQSVYAELLNEATSWLCLHLLRAPAAADRVRRWVALTATLDLLLRGTYRTEDTLRKAILESRAFARRAAFDLAAARSPLVDVGRWMHLESCLDRRLPLRAMRIASPRIAQALGSEPAVHRIISGLRRLARGAPEARFVGVHSLHLLCNKLGFSLADEYWAFSALYQLAFGEALSGDLQQYGIAGDLPDGSGSTYARAQHPAARDWKHNE